MAGLPHYLGCISAQRECATAAFCTPRARDAVAGSVCVSVVADAAVNVGCGHLFGLVFISFGPISRSGVSGSYGTLNF